MYTHTHTHTHTYTHTQWNTTQSQKWMKYHLQQYGQTWRFIILSEISERKTNIIWHYLYVYIKKYTIYADELIYKMEIDSQTEKASL